MLQNVSDLTVTQIRIFPSDVVPFSLLLTKSCIDKLREKFSFRGVEILPVPGNQVIVLSGGEIKPDKNLLIINRVEIDIRRIVLEVRGTSEETEEVFESLLSVLIDVGAIDPKPLHNPLLKAESSQCAVTLDFTPDALFSDVYLEFLNKKVEKEASNGTAKASIRALAAISEISYEIRDKNIIDNRVTMNPKQFTITVRAGVAAEAKRYLIASPFDSNTHFQLIETLNKAILGKK